MLRISNLFVGFGDKDILRDVTLEVRRGETLAVVGESGTGKTTLALSLLGLLEKHEDSARISGSIKIGDIEVTELDERGLRRIRWKRVSLVFQSTADALNPVHTVFAQVREPLTEHGICTGEEADRRAGETLASTGLPEDRFQSYPHELSTGEKQRVLIAMALMCDPDVIVLDEPTSSLDPLAKESITTLLRDRCADKACLVITHDLATAAALGDRIAVLCGGRIVEEGPMQETMADPRHPYSRGLIRCFPDMHRTKDLQGMRGRAVFRERGCPFYGRCTQSIGPCEKLAPKLTEYNGRRLACHRGGIIPLLKVRNLRKTYGNRKVLRGIDLTIYEGETLALVGASGTGKTTLARCLMGLAGADSGRMEIENQPVSHKEKAFYRRVQMVFQNPREAISHRLNVRQAVQEPLDVQRIGTTEQKKARVRAALRDAQLPDDQAFLNRYAHHLSGGELQRVVIARALVLEPEVLIADEPTSALDPSVQAKIIKLLNNLQEQRGLSLLFITHDIALARKCSDRMAVLRDGRIVESGNTSDMTRPTPNAESLVAALSPTPPTGR